MDEINHNSCPECEHEVTEEMSGVCHNCNTQDYE